LTKTLPEKRKENECELYSNYVFKVIAIMQNNIAIEVHCTTVVLTNLIILFY